MKTATLGAARVSKRLVNGAKTTATARRCLRGICCGVMLLFAVVNCTAQTQAYQGIEEKLPIEVAPQPIPFSHKQHVAARLACKDCHNSAYEKERAGLPDADQCMLCHSTIKADSALIQKLAALRTAEEKLEWVRVYRVPDFIFFSHASHVNADIECATCHGPVEQRDVLAKEVSTSMIQCMNCHRERKASISCHLCHELGQ